MIGESITQDMNVTLRIKHVLRNGKVFKKQDHQWVLKAIASIQPLKIRKYNAANADNRSVELCDVAMYALDWRNFASNILWTQSITKVKQLIFYKVLNNGTLSLKEMKKNKDFMALIKVLKGLFLSISFKERQHKMPDTSLAYTPSSQTGKIFVNA